MPVPARVDRPRSCPPRRGSRRTGPCRRGRAPSLVPQRREHVLALVAAAAAEVVGLRLAEVVAPADREEVVAEEEALGRAGGGGGDAVAAEAVGAAAGHPARALAIPADLGRRFGVPLAHDLAGRLAQELDMSALCHRVGRPAASRIEEARRGREVERLRLGRVAHAHVEARGGVVAPAVDQRQPSRARGLRDHADHVAARALDRPGGHVAAAAKDDPHHVLEPRPAHHERAPAQQRAAGAGRAGRVEAACRARRRRLGGGGAAAAPAGRPSPPEVGQLQPTLRRPATPARACTARAKASLVRRLRG